MKNFYTRSGDDGFTGLIGEGRVPKYHQRLESVGTIDEAAAALGIARAACKAEQSAQIVVIIQKDLYSLMAEIAATPENAPRFRGIDNARVRWLEARTDKIGAQVKLPKGFILPGDSPAGAAFALARTIVRRAERLVAKLLHEEELENTELLRYLNRLSSLCFVLELLENRVWGKGSLTLANG
jgi:cob(I)alamin adenosyltransferase